ncbi:hypothetical protein FHS82_003455 [Pseudochelatococcus lubricantis]|uniref:Uncharacterized protein n=1 Tax=Pseudochelatococcus lubricantis TaxID=1538102 RepID=A0ABX0V308_9HYPH|nr:hypothetical protein [Pseudochelatococcus lubricantis]NIJ59597.1 hypothetical protein [Pseudochelatococcus lubricantis]
MRIVAVLAFTLLAGAAHAAGGGAAATGSANAAAVAGPEMFSPEWRDEKVRDREANLRALDEEQRRFDRWERSAKQAVGGICADCLNGSGGRTVTIPGDAIPNYGAAGDSAGFDEMSAFYTSPASPQVPVATRVPSAPAVMPAPAVVSSPVAARSAGPLDIRTPAGR